MEIGCLEHELSTVRFKLSKAEDYEIKYDEAFKEKQRAVTDYLNLQDENERNLRELDRANIDRDQLAQQVKTLNY